MTNLVAAVVLALLIGLAFSVVRWLGHAATGKLKPLDPVKGAEAQGVSVVIDGDSPGKRPTAEALAGARDGRCALHDKPFQAMSVFKVVRAASALDLAGPIDRVEKRLFLPGCTDCLAEASRYKGFQWRRQGAHGQPVWASAEITPLLVADRYVELEDAAINFPWAEGEPIEIAAPAPTAPRSGFDEAALDRLREVKATMRELSIAPDLDMQALSLKLNELNQLVIASRKLLASDVVAFVNATNNHVIFTPTAVYYSASFTDPWRYRDYAAIKAVTLSEDNSDVVIDGKKVGNPFFRKERKILFARMVKDFLEAQARAARAPVA